MKRIVFHTSNFKKFWAHYSLHHDSIFKERLRARGYEFVFSSETGIKKSDYILFLEVKSLNNIWSVLPHLGFTAAIKYLIKFFLFQLKPDKPFNYNIYAKCKKNKSLDRTLLLILEGKIDAIENHSNSLKQLCNYVFTWNDDLVDNRNIIKINWPLPVEWAHFNIVPFNKKKLLTNISTNKYSSDKIEIYTTRRESIQYFENRFGSQFDLYGIGWNEPQNIMQRLGIMRNTFKSYKGKVVSKAETFSKYKFALIFENACVTSWITEKIFDCLRSDCIPIYFGAPNIQDYVPADLYIDKRNFRDDKELADFLVDMKEDTYNQYRAKVATYLNSSEFTKHFSTSLADTIINTIENIN